MSAPEYYLGSVKEALSYGANCFMFYTGAPQNTFRKPVNDLKIAEGRQLIKASRLDESKIIVHAPYIINLANTINPRTRELAISFLKEELKRAVAFNASLLVLHPGSHVGAGVDIGIKAIIDGLNEVLNSDKSDIKIALETMAGKGSEIGSNFKELKAIIDGVDKKERVGVCLDTCHINDAGYDVKNIDKIINTFDQEIGLNKLLVIHINDSLNALNAHKDRHTNIGVGHIGFTTLYQYVHHIKFAHIPKILETPYINEKPPYKKEIEMLKNNNFNLNWIYDF